MSRITMGTLGCLLGTFVAVPVAEACCGYGCCDCSCIARVPQPVADDVMQEIRKLFAAKGYRPSEINVEVKTSQGVIVLRKTDTKMTEQPPKAPQPAR